MGPRPGYWCGQAVRGRGETCDGASKTPATRVEVWQGRSEWHHSPWQKQVFLHPKGLWHTLALHRSNSSRETKHHHRGSFQVASPPRLPCRPPVGRRDGGSRVVLVLSIPLPGLPGLRRWRLTPTRTSLLVSLRRAGQLPGFDLSGPGTACVVPLLCDPERPIVSRTCFSASQPSKIRPQKQALDRWWTKTCITQGRQLVPRQRAVRLSHATPCHSMHLRSEMPDLLLVAGSLFPVPVSPSALSICQPTCNASKVSKVAQAHKSPLQLPLPPLPPL